MPQFLYLIRPVRHTMLTEGPTEDEQFIVSEHFKYLQRLMADGVLILAGRTQDVDPEGMGIVVFNAESEDAARGIMQNDPAVHAGVFSARLFPYRIALIAPDNISEE
jgi:uncharacterized protein YciI